MAFADSVASLATVILNRADLSRGQLPLTVGDVAAAALLLSANGAAAEISVVLRHGQEKLARGASRLVEDMRFLRRVLPPS